MINRIISNHKILLFLYGSIVVIIGSFFLVGDAGLLQELHFNLPLLFLIRFSLFWLMCLMIAVAGYLLHLSYNQLAMPEPDKAYAGRLGRLALYIGIAGCTIAFISFITLHQLS
jgi:hypothetical protein